jgi:hypothetical protein
MLCPSQQIYQWSYCYRFFPLSAHKIQSPINDNTGSLYSRRTYLLPQGTIEHGKYSANQSWALHPHNVRPHMDLPTLLYDLLLLHSQGLNVSIHAMQIGCYYSNFAARVILNRANECSHPAHQRQLQGEKVAKAHQ